MTIKIWNIRITVFKVEKLERADLSFDQSAAKKQAEEIKNSQQFHDLKARAAAIRSAR